MADSLLHIFKRRRKHPPVVVDMSNVHAVIHEVYTDAGCPCPYCTGEKPLKVVV